MTLKAQAILLVEPDFFDIRYAINPHMLDSAGKMQSVDHSKAIAQWRNLQQIYINLGIQTHTLPGVQDCPDMVFSANQCLFIPNSRKVILGEMRYPERKIEIKYFKHWLLENDFEPISLSLYSDESFEGCGDALWDRSGDWIWGGYGFRTHERAYQELERLEIKVQRLRLVSPKFYHLDTCFVLLDSKTAGFVPEAFDSSSQKKIENHFQNLIRISEKEAEEFFVANSYCPDGKHVITQKGSTTWTSNLKRFGFEPIETDTREFIKSGGSVFCLKNEIPVLA